MDTPPDGLVGPTEVPGAREDAPASLPRAPSPAAFDGRALPLALGGIAATVVAARLFSQLFRRYLFVSTTIYVLAFYAVVFGGLWLTCLTASRRFGTGHPWDDFGMRWRPSDVWRGLLAYVVARCVGAIAVTPVSGLVRGNPFDRVLLWGSWTTFGVFAVIAIVAAPLLEELTFRGLLQRTLSERFGARNAIVVQAVAFGLYHVSPTFGWANVPYVIALTSFGLVMGWVARRTRRLGPGCTAHAMANTLAMVFTALAR